MEDHPLLLLAAGNLGMEAVHKWTDALLPILNSMVSLGQIAVAVVTVIYIIRKTHLLRKRKPRSTRKPHTHEIKDSIDNTGN